MPKAHRYTSKPVKSFCPGLSATQTNEFFEMLWEITDYKEPFQDKAKRVYRAANDRLHDATLEEFVSWFDKTDYDEELSGSDTNLILLAALEAITAIEPMDDGTREITQETMVQIHKAIRGAKSLNNE